MLWPGGEEWQAGDPNSGGGGMEGMKNEVPELYRQQATTPLKAEIKAGDVNTVITLEMWTKPEQRHK